MPASLLARPSALAGPSPDPRALTSPRERIYRLLPALYRARDQQQGEVLRALLLLLEEQLDVVEADIARLYENWFIETCDEWVIPYLGDLLGTVPLNWAISGTAGERAYTAHTLAYRRQKGTLPVLRSLSRHVTQWPAAAVESSRHLGRSVHLAAASAKVPKRPDLRRSHTLTDLGGALLRGAHSLDLSGRHAPKDVTLFLWRLRSDRLLRVPARPATGPAHAYFIHPLGSDAPLWQPTWQTAWGTEVTAEGEVSLPCPIDAARLSAQLEALRVALVEQRPVSPDPREAPPLRIAVDGVELPLEQIVVRDLSAFTPAETARSYVRRGGANPTPVSLPIRAAVDPQRGRIVFSQDPGGEVTVSFAHAAVAELGGGGYNRSLPSPAEASLHRAERGQLTWPTLRENERCIIELADNYAYQPTDLHVPAGTDLELRAESGCRPLLRCARLRVTLAEGSTLRLSGLLIEGSLQLAAPELPVGGQRGAMLNVDRFNQPWGQRAPAVQILIEHCTLVPGLQLRESGVPVSPDAESLSCDGRFRHVDAQVRRSITGPLHLPSDDSQLQVEDSIIDAIGATRTALAAHQVTVLRSTVRGVVLAHRLGQLRDVILCGSAQVAEPHHGVVSHCYIEDPGPLTTESCQPQQALSLHSPDGESLAMLRARVQPTFTSTRYGQPGYFQLARCCAPEIARGGSDESEMGAFHHLYQPQRQANLRSAAEEHAPLASRVLLRYRT
jgi:hypothetical protein